MQKYVIVAHRTFSTNQIFRFFVRFEKIVTITGRARRRNRFSSRWVEFEKTRTAVGLWVFSPWTAWTMSAMSEGLRVALRGKTARR